MSKQLRPLGDRVIVRRRPGEEKTQGGILIPDSSKEKPAEGEVIAVGPGKFLDDGKRREVADVKKGDTVLFGKYAGTETKIGDEELVVLREDDIIGVVE